MANGDSPDILLTARIIHHWLEDMCTLDVLEKYPFITLDDFARAYERGEEVEAKWDYYLTTIGDNHPELLDFVKEAYEHPELRQLFHLPVLMYSFSVSVRVIHSRVMCRMLFLSKRIGIESSFPTK